MGGGVRLSSNEREFVVSALRQELRIDGRGPFDARRTLINFARENGAVEVQQGESRVLAVVTAQLVAPYPDRPNEGSFAIYTEFSPMADPSFEPGRPGELAIELGRVIDRGLRESKAVDTESLCVLAGKAVWALRIDIHILDNGGNLVDVANVAALAGLLSFRRSECSIGGEDGREVIVHPPEIREPLPLTLHHLPVAVTFGFFGDGDLVVLDPSLKEEAVMGGRLTVTVNAHGEVCAVQKSGGTGVRMSEILRCMRIASGRASDTAALLKSGAERHEIERAQRKIRRHTDPSKAVLIAESAQSMEAVKSEEAKDLAVKSDTDSENEQIKDEQQSKKEGGFFQGGNTTWDAINSQKPLDGEALKEFDMVVKHSTEAKPISEEMQGLASAASVYRQNPQLAEKGNRQLGPVLADENTDVEMVEQTTTKTTQPSSLVDAVKKKPKRRKKAGQI